MDHTGQLGRYWTTGFIGPPYLRMPTTLLPLVSRAKELAWPLPVGMGCPNNLFFFKRSLMFGVLISWVHFLLLMVMLLLYLLLIMFHNGWRLGPPKLIMLKFCVLKSLINDHGSHFCNKTMSTLLEKYEVVHRVATAYHSQINGQVEVFNREIKQILQKVVHPNRKDWSRKACNLPVEIEHHAYWVAKRCNLAFDQELRLETYENYKIYKEKVKCFHDNIILRNEFKVGQKVLLFNPRFKLITGKLHSKWDGAFVITNVFPYGAIEIRNEATDKTFKVNGHQLKLFHECPTMMEGDVEDLSLVKPSLSKLQILITSLNWKTMITLTLGAKGALELFWERVLHKHDSDTPRRCKLYLELHTTKLDNLDLWACWAAEAVVQVNSPRHHLRACDHVIQAQKYQSKE
ncbi:hypothetical protein CR513_33273, partial [Mucuna pruriens]